MLRALPILTQYFTIIIITSAFYASGIIDMYLIALITSLTVCFFEKLRDIIQRSKMLYMKLVLVPLLINILVLTFSSSNHNLVFEMFNLSYLLSFFFFVFFVSKVAGVEFQCSICLESNRTEEVVETRCHHLFHSNCLEEAMEHSDLCPMCRNVLTE